MKSYLFLFFLLSLVACQQKQNPKVSIETGLGNIVVELYPEKAPVTVSNFLQLVDDRIYSGASFYRVVRMDNQPDNEVKIEVIQGGLKEDSLIDGFSPIVHETTEQTGIKHLDGTISMARMEPGTASTEFFICVGDQPELDFGGKRNPDGQGFAAFGKVVKGMDVVRAIQRGTDANQLLNEAINIRGIFVQEE